jgi:general secretion pathway protein A
MYNDFFGLKASPFELSPDPFFMFSSEKSKEALTAISGAIGRRKGFVVLTGEVGTGKTLILRCLFELWEREQIPFAYFIGPRLSTTDFLSYINFELGIEVAEPTKGNLLRALYGFLLGQFERGLTTVLVIDEAHQLPRSVLEEIRLLTNFETAQQKLVQILLVGQPELDKKLDSVELRSLKQRIAVRCQLEPLPKEEVGRYIERRLELAGADSHAAAIFPEVTVDAIYRYSQGIPRLINNICDQALMGAYEQRVRVVPVEVIDEIALRFRLEPSPSKTEGSSSAGNQTGIKASNNSQDGAIAPNTAAAKDSDAIIMYLNEGDGIPAQTGAPSKPPASPGNSARDDSIPYTRKLKQQTIDRDKIREFLAEFDSQSRKSEREAVSFDLSALSDALASANNMSEQQASDSAHESAIAAASDHVQLTLEPPATAKEPEPVALTPEPETEKYAGSASNASAVPETEDLANAEMHTDSSAAENPPHVPESKAAAASANPSALHTTAEALKLGAARLQEQLSSFLWAARATPNDVRQPEAPVIDESVRMDATKALPLSDPASLLIDISNSPGMAALRANHEAGPAEIEEAPTLPAADETETPISPELGLDDVLATESAVEPDQGSPKSNSLRNKKGILTSAVAAGFLVLAAGGAQYLRRPSTPVQSTAAGVDQASAATPGFQSSAQNSAATRSMSQDSGTTSPANSVQGKGQFASPSQTKPGNAGLSANANLLEYKQLAEPSSDPKKSILGQVRLAKPKVNQSVRIQDANDAGAAPSIDPQANQSSDALSGGLTAVGGTELAASSAPLLVGGDVKPARIITSVSPAYPAFAKNQRIEGDVRVDAVVDVNGHVSAAKAISGPTLLQQAAVEALRQWKYQPATLDGKPVPMHLTVTIQFRIH